ncbi:MAG: DUF6434 domain-containing protein [Pseudomonadota bacterium]
MTHFDWHSDPITAETPVVAGFRTTQNVRRFFVAVCGPDFRIDRGFRAWLTDGRPKTMGQAAAEWARRQGRE